MKKLVYSFGVIGLLISCGGSTEETANTPDTANKDTTSQEPTVSEETVVENSFVLESETVGVFKIGEPLSKLPAELSSRKSTTKITKDGVEEEHVQHVIFNSLEDVVELVMEKNDAKAEEDLNVEEMRVISNYYETTDGIKVGSTVGDMIQEWGEARFFYLGASGEMVAESPKYLGVQFVLDKSGYNKKVTGKKDLPLSGSNFKDDTKVQYIRVY